MKLLCGEFEIPSASTTNAAGDSSVLLPETSLPSSLTPSPLLCSCTNAVKISSTCLAQQIQDQSMGDYDQICRQDDNSLVYVNIDGGMYLYYMEDIEVKSIFVYLFIVVSEITILIIENLEMVSFF